MTLRGTAPESVTEDCSVGQSRASALNVSLRLLASAAKMFALERPAE